MTEEERRQKAKEYRKAYREKNKEKIAAYMKKYQREHRNEIREYQREYRRNNPFSVQQWRDNAIANAYFKRLVDKEKNGSAGGEK